MSDQQQQYASDRQRIIGLTGGIGMGKTTISDYLGNVHKLPVLDTDLYAREAVEPGSTVLTEIAERYGSGILLPNGYLDRKRLGEIIFDSPAERLWLEQRVHPYVRDRLEKNLQTLLTQHHSTVVLVIPLLFEARMTDLVTEIWVVCCPEARQIEHLMQRDRLTLAQVQSRISSQMPIEQKVGRADIVIENSADLESLFHQVDLALAQSVPPNVVASQQHP
ncbi:dephospho-CoA kinase [Leptolyngbya sp. FACHB-671]|uniref:dephospho-CoA kinase n=1 Tax=Leptolyngbya sp. FACHB-671 TaxID=2692812 RepID=UPI001686EFCA|nr:dephospho-CoA kinase [Leptolyngbya sp. FACHB-671]MBD1866485.1 dephospho-CoA kinase [Cyanobacteria bacterium FACHB-471]MBD2070496.1 dephospho-CoA kinase [Leptolyngbya sp. FACHB-671]